MKKKSLKKPLSKLELGQLKGGNIVCDSNKNTTVGCRCDYWNPPGIDNSNSSYGCSCRCYY